MPMMDLSVALTNPYTLDTFNVTRQQENVDTTGFSQITTQTFTGLRGVIYAAAPSVLDRQPNMAVTPKAIQCITKFALRGESEMSPTNTFQPDIIVWNGNNYVVKSVDDYSNYGPGFINAMAVLFDAVANPPSTTPATDTTDGVLNG